MKRRAEYLVEKRDGRTEWLRATKLARSIHLALLAARVDEGWRALELACAVLSGLRSRSTEGPYLTTAAIADAVQQVLLATGHGDAAALYDAVASERQRRRRSVQRMLTVERGVRMDPAAPGMESGGGARRE